MIASALGPNLLASIIIPGLAVVLAAYPGNAAEGPRLVRIAPWFWTANAIGALLFLILKFVGKELPIDPDLKPSDFELWWTTLFPGPLVYTLVKRLPAFFVLAAIGLVVCESWAVYELIEKNFSNTQWFEFFGTSALEIGTTIYIVLWAKRSGKFTLNKL